MTTIKPSKKLLQFGAGNIGRGLIGPIFSQNNYEIIFADIDKKIVNQINSIKEYTVSYYKSERIVKVSNVSALQSNENQDKINKLFTEVDIITVSVGVDALQFIAQNIANGIKYLADKKINNNISILACENSYRATTNLSRLIKEKLSEKEIEFMETNILFFDTAIDGVIPDSTDSNNISLISENYFELIIEDKMDKFPLYNNIIKVSDIEPFINRKLFIVNMGHACIAWAGAQKGYTTIEESILDDEVRTLFENSVKESATVLKLMYPGMLKETESYTKKIIERFTTHVMPDKVSRVGRNPVNKLSETERFLKPTHEYIKRKDTLPINLLVSIALGVVYAVKINNKDTDISIEKMITNHMGIEEGSNAFKYLYRKIIEFNNEG